MVFAFNCYAPRATQPNGEGNASSVSVQYRCRHLNMYIVLLPIILMMMMMIIIIIIIIIIIVLIIGKMIVEWSPFFSKISYFIVDVCNIPFTLEFDFKHRNKRICV